MNKMRTDSSIISSRRNNVTDYEVVRGTAVVNLSGQTVIQEKFKDEQKIATIVNEGDGDVLVRVGIYGPDEMDYEFDADDWTREEDGFWYYKHVLPGTGTEAARSTSPITVLIDDIPQDVELTDMDIIVVHESIPLAVGSDGYYIVPADWKYKVRAE